jgi:hypothetical protein
MLTGDQVDINDCPNILTRMHLLNTHECRGRENAVPLTSSELNLDRLAGVPRAHECKVCVLHVLVRTHVCAYAFLHLRLHIFSFASGVVL